MKMPSPLDRINDDAQNRFSKLRQKFKLDTIKHLEEDKQVVAKVTGLTEEEFQEFQNTPEVKQVENQKTKLVDDTFDFIESLALPPQLSLAIGLIISANKTKSSANLGKAVAAIQAEGTMGDYRP